MAKRKHPIQPIEFVDNIIRFRENKIVSFLLDQYEPGLNEIRRKQLMDLFSEEDYEQLMMLIGYSVSGFGDLCLNNRTIATADRMAAKLAKTK